MKAFRFNLEQVLRLKHWREEEAKKALGVETVALEKLQARLQALGEEMRALAGKAAADEALASGFDFRGRLRLSQYALSLEEKIAEQRVAIAQQQERVRAQADLLAQAMRARKVLEKLRERRREEHRLLRNRHDYAALDEASAGMLRRLAGHSGADGFD